MQHQNLRGLFKDQGHTYHKPVKINGYQVELSTIEEVMKQYPGITDVVATVYNPAEKKIYAYYLSDRETSPRKLKFFLLSKLPHHMLPAYLIELDELPLTPNNKVDYQALADLHNLPSTMEITTEQESVQLIIENIWKKVLNVHQLSYNANFIELGGNSVKAFEISARLLSRGIKVTARHIFNLQTIDRLVAQVNSVRSPVATVQQPLTGSLKLPPAASWFMGRSFEQPGHYNQTLLFYLNRQPSVILFEQAFDLILNKHDGLRLNYNLLKHQLFYNRLHADSRFLIGEVSGLHLQSVADVLTHVEQEGYNQFNIQNDLLLKAALFSLTSGDSILAITAHRLIADGASWGILMEELYYNYTTLESGITPAVTLKPASLREWERARAERAGSLAHKLCLKEWNDVEQQHVSFFVDMSGIPQINNDTLKMKWMLDAIDMPYLLKEALANFTYDANVLLFGSFLQMMQQWTGNTHFLITNEYEGRDFDDFSFKETIGWFTAIYPAMWKWEGDTLIAKLDYLKEQTRVNSSRAIDYSIWMYNSGLFKSSKIEVADIQFNFWGEFGAELNNDLFSYCHKSPLQESHGDNPMTAKMEVNAMVIKEKLHIEIVFDSKTYLPSVIWELMDIWATSLQQMIADLKEWNFPSNNIRFLRHDLSESNKDDVFN
ncbi:condensation domain-containing protein [Mucilaginibacter sp. FT3.2]|uniref:condensation domain-containing protein n=1 Tax=Mucilaginibacter sp. FT3.2 TaxID=2723090 RepID=UPI00161BBCF2|nr:condensation domain-containing protein [Mucilaginibacter sp. FT3.2]MBB6230652.1 non-ribosomal peptide synthase protein (TIGR01720 family) [Mucilaginibacter sp. FT3.2]